MLIRIPIHVFDVFDDKKFKNGQMKKNLFLQFTYPQSDFSGGSDAYILVFNQK